jgi:hypothetical protein
MLVPKPQGSDSPKKNELLVKVINTQQMPRRLSCGKLHVPAGSRLSRSCRSRSAVSPWSSSASCSSRPTADSCELRGPRQRQRGPSSCCSCRPVAPVVTDSVSWQGESGVQSYDLDGVGHAPTQINCFVDHFNKQVCVCFVEVIARVVRLQSNCCAVSPMA